MLVNPGLTWNVPFILCNEIVCGLIQFLLRNHTSN